jgi:hypothetical protein
MPKDAPGSLTDPQYLEVATYLLLLESAVVEPDTPLSAGGLSDILLEQKPVPQPSPCQSGPVGFRNGPAYASMRQGRAHTTRRQCVQGRRQDPISAPRPEVTPGLSLRDPRNGSAA